MVRAIGFFSLILLCDALAIAADLAEADVFVAGKEGYHTYRIPALIVERQRRARNGHLHSDTHQLFARVDRTRGASEFL